MKFFSFQLSEVTRTPLAVMDKDAKACYDRIIMLLATIVSGHFGVPKQARDLQARAIRKMQFHLVKILQLEIGIHLIALFVSIQIFPT